MPYGLQVCLICSWHHSTMSLADRIDARGVGAACPLGAIPPCGARSCGEMEASTLARKRIAPQLTKKAQQHDTFLFKTSPNGAFSMLGLPIRATPYMRIIGQRSARA